MEAEIIRDTGQNDTESISMANDLLLKFGCASHVSSLDQCDHKYFVHIYEAMLGETLPGLTVSPETPEGQIHNVQVVVDSLATDVLGIDLSHINTQNIVNKDYVQIRNLLEIFDGLLDFVLEELDKDGEQVHSSEALVDKEKETAINDSNILPDDHNVLSDVFLEEFGQSYTINNMKNNSKNQSKANSPSKAFYKDKIITHDNNSVSSGYSWTKHGGDSTNELIREAEIIEQAAIKNRTGNKVDRQGQQLDQLGKQNYPSNTTEGWSSILTQTSSAVDSIMEIKEIGQRPRDKLPVEKRVEENRKSRVHKHTHHHYHHHVSESPHSDTCSLASSSSSLNKANQIVSDHHSSGKSMEQYSESFQSTSIQTQTPSLVDTSVQTDCREKDFNNVVKKVQSNVFETSIPSHIDYLKEVKQSSLSVAGPSETRSKQLSDLSLRLQKIRGEFKEDNRESEDDGALHRTSNAKYGMHKTKEKEKSKVSFAAEPRLIEREFYSSDTEVDYSSPCADRRSRWRHNRDYSEAPGRKSILRRKTVLSDGSTSSGEDISIPFQISNDPKSITARFEEPFLKRDERLLELRKAFLSEQKENQDGVKKLHGRYSKQRGVLMNQQGNLKKQSNLNILRPRPQSKIVTKQKPKSTVYKMDGKLNNGCKQRGRTDKIKARKRSASASPVGRRRRKTPMVLGEDEILPIMEEEFPFIYLSPHTAKLMWQKQVRQMSALSKVGRPHKSFKMQRRLEEAQRKQEALTGIMMKELDHNKRLKEHKDQKDDEYSVKRKLDERRHRSARARRYYDEYVIRNKARMLKKRTKEEKIFKNLFEEGLEIQKQRIREMREYAKEQKEKNAKKQQNEIESLENYYRDQFSMLAGSIAQERYETEVRQKAQKQVLHKMRSEMRKRMEKDVRDIQEHLTNDEDAVYFRQLDADNLKREFQLATYKASQLKR